MKNLILIVFILCTNYLFGQVAATETDTLVPAHDPVMIREGSRYYVFCTGRGISVYASTNMKSWKRQAPVFSSPPQWAVDTIPGFKGHIWAPDISYHNGLFYLYYSVSAFGKNTSAIGVATNKTLDTTSPNFKWIDHGRVIQSYPGVTNWNAIDPNIITDEKGQPWLSFGSFWDGLKLVKLRTDRLRIADDANKIPTIASRKKGAAAHNPDAIDDNPKDAGGNAIEAPFIYYKNGYYYLFASIDYCCKGVKSTYKMIVGRSETVQGPYMDKDNISMASGGGTLVLAGNEKWYGVGHNAVVGFDGTDFLVFHGYDAADNGRSKLRIEKLEWDGNGWPAVKL